MGELVGFPFEGTDFIEGERDGSRVLFAETASGTYVLRNIEGRDAIVEELKRLANAHHGGKAYDDKNVYVMPAEI